MEAVLSFVKSYFILVLILLVFSYLVPKESYKKYVRFFIGVLMAVLLLQPVLSWMQMDDSSFVYENLKEITRKLESIQYEGDKEDIFELFFLEGDLE